VAHVNSTISHAGRQIQGTVCGRSHLWALLCVFCLSTMLYASSRSSTDIVVMKNGDRITCEIRSLEQAQLIVKQGYASSTVALDWKEVDHIETHQPFVIIDTTGKALSGELSESSDTRIVSVTGEEKAEIAHNDVVSIEQTGKTFIRRMRGDIDVGVSVAKSNSQKNLTLQSDLTYQATKRFFSLSSSAQYTSQEKTTNTREITIKTEYYRRLRESNWYSGGIANFLSSSAQQIDLRSSLGGAIGFRPIYTNKTNLSFTGALAYTVEKDAPNVVTTASSNSLDSAASVQYSTFRFDSTNFDTVLWVYPSLTSLGRVRMTLNQDVYYKFLKDFYIRLSFYDNYDNRPVVGAPSNNLGVTSTIGWSFR
jgi:Protein of unknown function, DUF481